MPVDKAEVVENKADLINVILATEEIGKHFFQYKLLEFHVLEGVVILDVDVEDTVLFANVIGEKMQLAEEDKFP